MKHSSLARIITTSLAIFAMLFGAGNLMLPLKIGMLAGPYTLYALIGFIITGVLVPLLGLLAIIAFDGDYRLFFERIGAKPASVAIAVCMLIIGPAIVMPRIIALSYEMLQPFLPDMPVFAFACIFISLVGIATYKPGRLLTLIGRILSPLKIISLATIIILGIIRKGNLSSPLLANAHEAFNTGIGYGYITLDLLAALFFGSIIVSMLGRNQKDPCNLDTPSDNTLFTASIASIIAAALLSIIYAGMSYIGAWYGNGLNHLNEGQIFSAISFKILGTCGAALIGTTVFLACFITIIALAAVVSNYMYHDIFSCRIGYGTTVSGLLILCLMPASYGLTTILSISAPLIFMAYPLLITLTLCNILYKAFGFTWIKLPLVLTALASLVYWLL
jgi:branched-chain amino acid:cation transporter, LIVCS family